MKKLSFLFLSILMSMIVISCGKDNKGNVSSAEEMITESQELVLESDDNLEILERTEEMKDSVEEDSDKGENGAEQKVEDSYKGYKENVQAEEDKTGAKDIKALEDYLLEKGVLKGNRTEMGASLIGAVSGFKYENGEIYEYDTESEAYKRILNGESIEIEGMAGFEVKFDAVNDGFCLYMENEDHALLKAFQSF